jgi:hypothetical protein
MVLLGFLLLAASAGLAVDIVSENTTSSQVLAFGHTYTVTPGGLFVIGGATAIVGLLGLVVMLRGMAAARRRRAALHQSLGAAEGLKAERDRLAAALDAERIAHEALEHRADSSVRVGAATAEALAMAAGGHPAT